METNNYHFAVMCESDLLPDNGNKHYGIIAENGNGDIAEVVHRVSTKREFVECIVERCEHGSLSPRQLREVIEDLLSDLD